MDAGGRGRGLRADADPEPLAPFRDQLLVLTRPANAGVAAGEAAGDHAARVDAFPDRRAVQADRRRDMSTPACRWIRSRPSELGAETQLASLELALESDETSPARATSGSAAPTPTRSSWRSADDAAADGEQSARRVRAAVRRQRQHRPRRARRARLRKDRSILDSVTERVRDLQQGLGAQRPLEARRVSRGDSRRRAADPEGRGAERPRAAGRRAAARASRRRSTSTSS